MNLVQAPFHQLLRIQNVQGCEKDVLLVLLQLGIDQGEQIQKLHTAPLGDPLSILVGEQVFSLRKEICEKILVEPA